MRKIWFLICFFSIAALANPSIERGKKYFYQYCSGCHSLQYGKQETKLQSNLRETDAKKWFGQVPPDLSLITLQYSKKWVIDYLTGFYPDHQARFGVNNKVIAHVAMPHVLASPTHLGFENKSAKIEIESIAMDIGNYLAEVAEPEIHHRLFWGVGVLFFCIIAILMFIVLNKLYKK